MSILVLSILKLYKGDFMVCTFFGHRVVTEDVKESLREILTELIEFLEVDMFYVGNNGAFDRLVINVLRDLKKTIII